MIRAATVNDAVRTAEIEVASSRYAYQNILSDECLKDLTVENRVRRDVTLFFEVSCPGLKPDQITEDEWQLPGKTFRVKTNRTGMQMTADENHTIRICYPLATGSSQSFVFSWN